MQTWDRVLFSFLFPALFIMKKWKEKGTQTKLFVRLSIDRTNPYGNRHKSNGKKRVMRRSEGWIAAQGIAFIHNSEMIIIWGYVKRERVKERECRTEETRSWDLHVFIAEALQTWIMQILSLQNKNKKASFAIPSINFLTSQKHPPPFNSFYFSLALKLVFLFFISQILSTPVNL